MAGQEDDFKGFGDRFEGFPKHLPQDSVEYSLFIIDAKLKSQREILACLETVRKEALKLTESLLKKYIWQRESFDLKIESEKAVMYLHGLTNYGDSVEDEWLIVYVLKELSNRFPTLWIKIVDTDGEFLLIEAANALPRWLNPEIADNRVWLHHNTLRIIPLSAAPSTSTTKGTAPISQTLSLEEALETILSTPEDLIHSPTIEEEAFYRLWNYPSQIAASMHYATITIPRKLAYILHELPASIAPAVEAFYLRDPIALKPLQTNSTSLIFLPVDLVTVSVRFSKVLYAQLKSQQFSPPSSWKGILSQDEKGAFSQKRHTQLEMGMKATSGFEMLVTDPSNGDSRKVREIQILLDDLANDENSSLPGDIEIAGWPEIGREDDEKWLDINFEDFEKELEGKKQNENKRFVPGAFGPEPPPGFGDAKTQADLKKMVERFEAFLNDDDTRADGTGLDDMDVDDDDDDEDSEEDSEDEDKDVSFDEKEFSKMMREMMGMPSEEVDDDLSPRGAKSKPRESNRIEEIDTDDEASGDDEVSQIRKVMEKMKAELDDAGALNLDPTPTKLAVLKENSKQGTGSGETSKEDWEDESDEDLKIDFNLAKNLLETFKNQGGMAGPGGNLLGMMGIQLPRDDDETRTFKKQG